MPRNTLAIGIVVKLSVFGLLVAACGGDGDPSQTAAARSFDQLAETLSSCGDDLRACMTRDPGSINLQKCRTTFRDCTTNAGRSAEESLADAISACDDRYDICRAAQPASEMNECTESLRSCLGDASASTQNNGGAGAVRTNPPTYQCFGQLRECVSASSAPSKCAQEARACVTGAVGEPSSIDYPIRPRAGRGGSAAGSGTDGIGGIGGLGGAGQP